MINCFRKRYLSGQTPRERIGALIFGQPLSVQRIILPDYEGDPDPVTQQRTQQQTQQRTQQQTQQILASSNLQTSHYRCQTRAASSSSRTLDDSHRRNPQEALLDHGLEQVRRRLERVVDDDDDDDEDHTASQPGIAPNQPFPLPAPTAPPTAKPATTAQRPAPWQTQRY
ncbi:uncharacterized protein LOC117190693 [Drosophila miranda]|uniref:uncharacterized protein LOC117190693 n=1 Tax=Drosophila miranda TaxID=7229 RepID=UPI00143F0C84|nr:uncharacterized protein LOC117190693 [Drosophila miranda]